MQLVSIYRLRDPETHEIRYVGQTKRGVAEQMLLEALRPETWTEAEWEEFHRLHAEHVRDYMPCFCKWIVSEWRKRVRP